MSSAQPPKSSDTTLDDTLAHGSAVADLCSAVTTSGPQPAPWKDGLPTSLPTRLGRYNLLQLLGKGGMGAVYLARDTQLERQVALKLPHFNPKDGPEILERFQREARAAAKLHHPGICSMFDVGVIDGVHYLTMSYIEGKPLRELVKDGKPLPPLQAAAIVQQVALAMQHAHDRGIIHRDLKPHNILLNELGQPVVMDFGLARRITGPAEVRLTASGILLGTPAYMAPEQIEDGPQKVSPASDIYTLGVILYELLTGKLPFGGPLATMLAQIMFDPPPLPNEFQAGLDPTLVALCLKALAKRPEDRYRSMGEFATALGDYLNRTPPAGQPAAQPAGDATIPFSPRPASVAGADTLVHQTPPASAAPRQGTGWLLALAVAIPAAVVTVLGGVFLYKHHALDTPSSQKNAPAPPAENKEKGVPEAGKERGAAPGRDKVPGPPQARRPGDVPAPDLATAKQLFAEEFSDPRNKRWLVNKGERAEFGFKDGKYYLQSYKGGIWRANLPHAAFEDFACRVVGRVRTPRPADAWGLMLSHADPKADVLRIRISRDGDLYVVKFDPEAEQRVSTLAGPIRHPAIKSEEAFDTLLVIVRSRLLGVYVNGVAVCDPIALPDKEFTPAVIGLGLFGGPDGATAEYEQVAVWSAADIPLPGTRAGAG
jgi:predicted Ser/Thr protein kinase